MEVEVESGWKLGAEDIGIDAPVEEEDLRPTLAHDDEAVGAFAEGEALVKRGGHGLLNHRF